MRQAGKVEQDFSLLLPGCLFHRTAILSGWMGEHRLSVTPPGVGSLSNSGVGYTEGSELSVCVEGGKEGRRKGGRGWGHPSFESPFR